jgi:hypothetical protein
MDSTAGSMTTPWKESTLIQVVGVPQRYGKEFDMS